MGNGLEIMLDIQQDEYLPIWRETSKLHNCLYAVIPSHATGGCSSARVYVRINTTCTEFSRSCKANNAFSDCLVRQRISFEMESKLKFMGKINRLTP